MPDLPIDLFTDQAVTDDVFDRVWPLELGGFFRPKLEAMQKSRFDQTLLLDSDLFVLKSIEDVFEILDFCDIAGAQGINREKKMMGDSNEIPRSFPLINCGLLVFTKGDAIRSFADEWKKRVISTNAKYDQPAFRQMLYEGWARFQSLPQEYNVINLEYLYAWRKVQGAPRVLHCQNLHRQDLKDPHKPFILDEVLDKDQTQWVKQLLAEEDNGVATEPKRAPIHRYLQKLRGQ
ncbi:hypothetical protein [Salipiger abyssi]|uniref:hypothetical protein n=1 Tax=Salipiger abyssi TaxID=1250539 RepID=UPI001A8F5F37|nr:hypothetical protein [Salipiger abyssi]MBN9887534.1 hypothetical protein [Salipiger abyssi]